jgi:hypothetical protein
MCENHNHFRGKPAVDHLKEARLETKSKLRENHAITPNSPLMCGLDCAKETAVVLSLIAFFIHDLIFLFIFLSGFLVWRTTRSAFYAWNHLDKLHRVIEEERFEITHHRAQEKEELIELYKLKGFKGELLTQVIDVLMADDNRLLSVMLEEELGLEMGAEEHPVKAGIASLIGVCLSGLVLLTSFILNPLFLLPSAIVVFLAISIFQARCNKAHTLYSATWSLACFLLSLGTAYFLEKALSHGH